MFWKLLYSAKSPSEHGTLYQLRNVINRRNVVKKPIDNFNACDDFFMTVVISHILVVAIKYLKLKSLLEIPSDDVIPDAENLWMQPKEVRKDVIESTSQKIVEKYVSFKFCDPESSEESEYASDNEVEGSMAGSGTSIEDDDLVKGYARQLLSVGLFYWEYSDSIREGDGERLLRCWRYMLPMFINTGRKNYSIEALRFLYQYTYVLPPRQAVQLLYSRFVNVHGLPGHNIAADLHMEHLNAIAKRCVKALGANKTEAAIQRATKALGTIVPVLNQFDTENSVSIPSGAHKRASAEKDILILITELLNFEVFDKIPGRKHKSFSTINILHKNSHNELYEWINKRLD